MAARAAKPTVIEGSIFSFKFLNGKQRQLSCNLLVFVQGILLYITVQLPFFLAFVWLWFSHFFCFPTWGKCRKISHVGVYLNVLLMMIAGRRQRATGHRAGRELRHKTKRTVWDDGKNGIRNSNKLDTRPCGKLSGLDPWGFLAVPLFGLIWKRAIRKFNFFQLLERC